MRTMEVLKILLVCALCVLCSCAPFRDKSADRAVDSPRVSEHSVIAIPMEGEITRSAEISGLAWYGDDLVLLPRRPERFSFSDDGALFVLSREHILAFLAGEDMEPLSPRKVSFVAPGIRTGVPGYEGYEAIAFHGTRVFMTMRTGTDLGTTAHLITGRVAPDGRAIVMDSTVLTPIHPQANLPDFSDRALVVNGERVITIFEANGEAVNPRPSAHVFDHKGEPAGTVPFPALEYRVTDATAPDEAGRFWVMNSHFPGDPGKDTQGPDPLRELYGAGPSHLRHDSVERLVEFRDTGDRVEHTRRPPLQLKLMDDFQPRNWEGLARLDPYGFLVAADNLSGTPLAFIPNGTRP